MNLNHIKAEIARMRVQIKRQQRDIQDLQRAGISNASAVALLERMQDKVDTLCLERDRLNGEERLKARTYSTGKAIRGADHRRV
jgi:hypothetical protein